LHLRIQRILKCKLYIVLAAFAVGFTPAAHAQPLDTACVRGKSLFNLASGPHSVASTYHYSISGGGVIIDSVKPYRVVVQWGAHRGQYRFGAQEILLDSCAVGQWAYIDIELVGTPFYFAKKQRRLCAGETLHIPIDTKLYKEDSTRWYKKDGIRWLEDTAAAERGIVEPGHYRVLVEDMFGCKYADTLRVETCIPPP